MPDVISNTSPLQYLHRVALLDLLRQHYGTVTVRMAVIREIESGVIAGADVPSLSTLPWIRIESVPGTAQQVAGSLGQGEREAIRLALTKSQPLLLLDDRNARREAQKLGISCTGVLGVLLKAKQRGTIRDVAPLLDDLHQGFYLDAATRTHVLRLAGEAP